MNCATHPDAAAAAYCQQCGKPLCSECVRSIGLVVNCESCLEARLGAGPGAGTGQWAGPGAQPPFLPPAHPSPVLAGLLGFIPGVGAMYNGQFVKALAHVLIFAVFVDLAKASIVFVLLTFAWVFYQVFDAYQTALARRDGLPLPNPFGLNDLGPHLGFTGFTGFTAGSTGGVTSGLNGGFTAHPSNPPPGATPPPASSGSAAEAQAETRTEEGARAASGGEPAPNWSHDWAPPPYAPQAPPYTQSAPYAAPAPSYAPAVTPSEARVPAGAPTGAIVLIVVGVFLLLETLGIVRLFWIGRLWPVLFIALGVWLAVRQRRRRGGETR